jgi:hypothetical protein
MLVSDMVERMWKKVAYLLHIGHSFNLWTIPIILFLITAEAMVGMIEPKASPVTSELYHVVITANTHVNRMARLEGNMRLYTGGGCVTVWGRCEGSWSMSLLAMVLYSSSLVLLYPSYMCTHSLEHYTCLLNACWKPPLIMFWSTIVVAARSYQFYSPSWLCIICHELSSALELLEPFENSFTFQTLLSIRFQVFHWE